jgi:small subunit ribosomal protein S21
MQNIHLVVDDRNPVEKTLKRFKRMCDSYGIVKVYRSKQEYKKPSIKAKEKSEAAEKRRRKAVVKFRRSSGKI